ncbi:uncharacterized protein N7498_006461 [Penicillium cinerascens]|uniref:DUF7137 domain-containing protein n=1 Tax=Penicillium cinerascens TaxID=70096 RepID=A0A9W9SXC5_9EURO|nr:uncharacterized protein N7498_006461 [Penicillium cinerascens]KAJ5201798.1 hypothetical protein N7498_006461 [Penicillium cinerascens]
MRSFIVTFLFTVLLCTVTSAWPWGSHGEVYARDAILDRRAESTSTDGTTTATAESTSNTPTTSTGTSASDTTDTATTGQTTSGTKTDTKTKSKTTTSTSISINPAAGAGGISMITPAATSTTYYMIGQDITFVWNYTSLSVTPTAVDVVASCSINSQIYTLTQNMSAEATGTYIWDTGKYQSSATIPLLTATYTLFVYDASKSLSDTPVAGYLGSNIGYSFGMYTPQPYTPLGEFRCATCSGSISDIQRQGIKFALGMALITIASFSWFVGGLGIFSS